MPAAPLPPDESERLALLRLLNILDSDPEPVFDQVTRLASKILNVPIALFSLVDEDRQWFKSNIGLTIQETPREVAFCAHSILNTAPLVVADARIDPRFSDNPFVTGGPEIRFYAGVPIRNQSGIALGTLCTMDSKPRILTTDELQSLNDLASILTKEIEYRERLALARQSVEETDIAWNVSESRFGAVFELSSIGMALVAPDKGMLRCNDTLCQILGYSEAELSRLNLEQITYPADIKTDATLFNQLQSGKINQYEVEKRYIKKDGTFVWINLNLTKKINLAGEIAYYIAAISNIQTRKQTEANLQLLHAELEKRVEARTEELLDTVNSLNSSIIRQQQAEKRLSEAEYELRSVLENANDAYISLDSKGVVQAWNKQATNTFGWSANEAIGNTLDKLIFPNRKGTKSHSILLEHDGKIASRILGQRVEIEVVCKDRSQLTVEVRFTAIDVNGKLMFSAFLHDISERKRIEMQREYEARHDVLTGLLNRRALIAALPMSQAHTKRTKKSLGVLFIDLDGFKAINDNFGHEAGDKLLNEIARRMNSTVRKTDKVFRLAGDEFAVLLEDMSSTFDDAYTVASKLRLSISEPIHIGKGEVTVGASIGIAVFAPNDTTTASELIREADSWMYEAKKAGKGQVRPNKKA